MSAPSPTAAPPRVSARSLDPEIRRIAVWLVRFIGALLLVWLAVWWVLPVHVFSGPVIWVIDGRDQHGLHLGDLPAALWVVAALWLAWPTRRGQPAHHGASDALRLAAVGGLGALSLYWIVPEHSWSGPTIVQLGHRHGMHVLDPVVVLFLGAAVLLGWRWYQPVAAGFLAVFALWWAKGSHAAFSGPVILRWREHVLQRADPLALVFLAGAVVIGLPWARQRWARVQRERAERLARAPRAVRRRSKTAVVRPPPALPVLAAALLALVLTVGAAACGDDDDGSPGGVTTPPAGPGTTETTLESAAATVATATLAVGPVSNPASVASGASPATAAASAAASTATTRSTGTVTPGAGPATGTVAAATQPITVPGPTTAR